MSATKKTTASKTAQTVEDAMNAGRESIESVIQAGADAFKGYDDVVSFGKDNVDAVMKSNAIFVQGMQGINAALFGLAQTAMENSVAATQKILGCKTPQDALDAQAELARTSYAKAFEDGRQISDLSAKLADAASQPITKQVNKTVEKFNKPMAA